MKETFLFTYLCLVLLAYTTMPRDWLDWFDESKHGRMAI